MSAGLYSTAGAAGSGSARNEHRRRRARTGVWARSTVCALLVCLLSGPAAQAAGPQEEDLLLLNVTLGPQQLAASVTAYAQGNSALVSLSEIGAALEFPIVVEAEAGTASGWFIRPDRSFRLDLGRGQVEIDGVRQTLAAGDAIVHDGMILVPLATFSRWFPVDLSLSMTGLTIEVTPREPIPVQTRQDRRRGAQQVAGVGPATLPRIDAPYRVIGPPAADIGLGYSVRRNADGSRATTGLSHSALIAGDLAFMDSRIYLAGNDRQALSNARMSLSRDNLGLPLGLRYVELGDIVPPAVQGTVPVGVERGLLLQGGGAFSGRDNLIDGDVMHVYGDALPNWDVELFQNGMRVGFQTVGPDGRYDFRDIEPVPGENEFELVFYGPSGERRSEKLTRYSGLSPERPGSLRYQLAVSEKGTPLYQADGAPELMTSDRGTARIAAGLDVRVLPRLALRGAWNSVMVDGERRNFHTLGLRTGWNDLTLGVDATRDPLGGTRWDASLQIPSRLKLWGFDTRLSHTQYASSLWEDSSNELRLRSRTGVSLSGPLGPVATRLAMYHNREPDRFSNTLSAGFTSRFRNLGFGNTFHYSQFGRSRTTGLREDKRLGGSLFVNAAAYPLSVRAGLSYTLQPEARSNQYFVDSNLRIAPDMSMQFGLMHNPATGITRYTSGFNWQLPQLMLSPRIAYDSTGEYSGFVYASFSLAPRPDRSGLMMSGRPLASSGLVAGRVFVDHDGSGDLSAGDEPVPGATVLAPQAFRSAQTDAQGVAYLSALPTERATDVVLARDSLPEASLAPAHPGNAVRPRPTAPVVIDFPVVPTGEIDGRVFAVGQGSRTPLRGVMVELHDAAGRVVAFKVSTYDGSFAFDDVPYGAYQLKIGGERGRALAPRLVTLGRERNLVSNVHLEVPVAGTPSVPRLPASSGAGPAVPGDGRLSQLGVFSNPRNAEKYLQELLARDDLRGVGLDIVTDAAGDPGLLYRVIARPRTTTADALCKTLRARGVGCMPVAR